MAISLKRPLRVAVDVDRNVCRRQAERYAALSRTEGSEWLNGFYRGMAAAFGDVAKWLLEDLETSTDA